MQFHDNTAYVWGLRYRWYPSLSMNLVRRFAHFMPPCCKAYLFCWHESHNIFEDFFSLFTSQVATWLAAERLSKGSLCKEEKLPDVFLFWFCCSCRISSFVSILFASQFLQNDKVLQTVEIAHLHPLVQPLDKKELESLKGTNCCIAILALDQEFIWWLGTLSERLQFDLEGFPGGHRTPS